MENIKSLTREEKIEKLRSFMQGNDLDDDLALNVFLLICPAKNFNSDFFEHEKIMYGSLIEFVTITGALKQDMIAFCVPVTVDKRETNVPEQFLKIFALLDFQRIAKLYEKYEVIPETNKYTNAYKVIYPFIKQFDFYENLMSEGGFGDGSGK